MSNLLNSYPIFESNQVLTSSQLNQLVAYLDEQNRLTRAKLIGTGIACGFDLKFNNAVTPYELTIFQGMGITSEGYLITEGDCVVRRYRDYVLPKGLRYEPFEDPETTLQDVVLWELLTDDAPTLPTDNIRFLNVPANFVNDKVVLLFIEALDVDLKSCLGKACDENGIDREFHLRKLLIGKRDLEKVLARLCDQSSSLFPQKYDLPEIFMKRALFQSPEDSSTPNSTDYFVFSQTYINALRSTAKPATGITIYNQLFRALKQTYIDFSPILSEQYGGVNPFAALPSPAWTNYLGGISSGPRYLGMQYFYDFIKDLILAYNEFRDVAFDLMSECCMDMDCFPKHLMLGEVIATGSDKPSRYRHYFTTSPIFNNQKEKLALAVSLFQRIVLMVRKFDLQTINDPNTTVFSEGQLPVPIYITPSNEKRDPLSKRSIPYYYRIHEPEAGLGTLEQSWNYMYKQKALFAKGLAPLAYGNQDIVQENDQGPVKTPLYYDKDPYNFLRIEGHLRTEYYKAQEAIEQIKKDFDLPFNVIALRLNGDSYDNLAERCNFDDLRTEYGTIRLELLGMMKTIFDRYGLDGDRGRPVLKGFPKFMGLLVRDCNTETKHASIHQPQTGIRAVRSDLTIGVTASPVSVPVYAPLRTMEEAIQKLNSDLLELLENINQVKEQLPFDMLKFRYGYKGTAVDSTPGFIQYYFAAMQAAINVKVDFNQLFDLVIRNTKIRNTPELYMDIVGYAVESFSLLEKFITDVKYRSLTLLNYTFFYRLNQLKENDMTVFSNFIKKHPGVEHQAGVPYGGTFILVYPGNAVAIDPIRRNFAVSEARAVKGIKTEIAQIKAKPVMTREDQMIVAQGEATLLNFNAISHEIALPFIPIQKIAIKGEQVIADFTLPYLCCCDCECDEIKPATELIQLGIPTLAVPFYAEYCLGDYAFGKDINVAMQSAIAREFVIDIIPMLQYDKRMYNESQVRLYLVNKYGNKLPLSLSSMQTGNYPNEPVTGAARGVVAVASSTITQSQAFFYSVFIPPSDGELIAAAAESYTGIDSFYYMFEIVTEGENPVVLERSTMGKVTVDLVGR